jgi:hypothetical protein
MEVESLIHVFYEKVREIVFLKQSTDLDHTKFGQFALHKARCDLEPYVYNYLENKYGNQLTEFWKTHQFPVKSKYAWAIVERRCHPNWWFVLRNIAWAGPHMSLYIFCSDENLGYLKSLLGDKAANVHLLLVFKGFANRTDGFRQMEKLMTSPEFYGGIDADYILTFQTDCFFRKKVPQGIFVGDYYGSPWGWSLEDLGGGGITVRNVQRMIDLCSKEVAPEGIAEDGWIGGLVKRHGGSVPPDSIRFMAFCENFPTPDPIGVHQFWTFLHNFGMNEPEKFKKNMETVLKLEIV